MFSLHVLSSFGNIIAVYELNNDTNNYGVNNDTNSIWCLDCAPKAPTAGVNEWCPTHTAC